MLPRLRPVALTLTPAVPVDRSVASRCQSHCGGETDLSLPGAIPSNCQTSPTDPPTPRGLEANDATLQGSSRTDHPSTDGRLVFHVKHPHSGMSRSCAGTAHEAMCPTRPDATSARTDGDPRSQVCLVSTRV